MQGKRHAIGDVERRGKADQLGRDLKQRYQDYPNFNQEFGHLEGDTPQGKNYQGAVTTKISNQEKAPIITGLRQKSGIKLGSVSKLFKQNTN